MSKKLSEFERYDRKRKLEKEGQIVKKKDSKQSKPKMGRPKSYNMTKTGFSDYDTDYDET